MSLNIIDNPALVYTILILGGIANFVTFPDGIASIIKKVFGAAWMATALYATFSLFTEGFKKMSAPNATAQTSIQWWIILIIFSIVMVGFFIHGYYSLRGEYDNDK